MPIGVIILALLGFLFFRHQRKGTSEYASPTTAGKFPPLSDQHVQEGHTSLEQQSAMTEIMGLDQGEHTSLGKQSVATELAGHEGPIPWVRYEMPASK